MNFTHFSYSSEEPGIVKAFEYIDGFTSHKFRLGTSNLVQLPQNPAYPLGKVPINSKKLENIRQLFTYIPENFKDFYNDLSSWPTNENEEN